MKIFNPKLDEFEKYRFISENYEKNIIYSFKGQNNLAKGKIIKVEKIKNGYRVKLEVFNKGLFVFNNFYSKYWKIYSDGKNLELINLADIHIGVELKIGINEVEFIYDRPLLKNKVYEYLKTNL